MISQLRKIAKIARSSSQRLELFHNVTRQLLAALRRQAGPGANNTSPQLLNPIIDVITRWNSLLYMLERSLHHREVSTMRNGCVSS